MPSTDARDLSRLTEIRHAMPTSPPGDAIQALAQYLEDHPDDMGAIYLLGCAHYAAGQAPEALEAFEKVYLSDPAKPEHRANRGLALAAVKQYDEAEPVLNDVRRDLESLEKPTGEQRALLLRVLDGLARVHIEQSRLEEALDIAETRIRLSRSDAEGYFLRGSLRLMLDSPGRAIADCEKALHLNPHEPRYHYNYGFALFVVGRDAEAAQAFDRFYRRNPDLASRFVYASIHAQFARTRDLMLFNQRMRARNRSRNILGDSPTMQVLFKQIAKIGDARVAVLLQGDTGTGKELFASALHSASLRKGRFVPINAPAIPDTLIESELFGYKKGAFTGAIRDHRGVFEQADEGTLFIDEIAELSLLAQAKLLRAVEEQEIRPLGSEATTKINVRLIAATRENLEQRVAEGRFREDLFYRLDIITFRIPRLKDRPEDIQLLAEHFINLAVTEHNRDPKYLSPEALANLKAYDWPGNVRRLKTAMEHAVIMAEKETITSADLPEYVREIPEKKRLIQALQNHLEPNITATADALGYSREHLHRLIKKHGISPQEILSRART